MHTSLLCCLLLVRAFSEHGLILEAPIRYVCLLKEDDGFGAISRLLHCEEAE